MADPSAAAEPFDFDAIHQAIARLRRKQVFFVGGAPKSGTTWLQLMLNAHPEVSCSGEGHYADRLLPTLTRALKEHNATISLKNRSIFDGLDGQALFTNRHVLFLATAAIGLMLTQPARAETVPIVGDKTPDNVRLFPLLATLFPQARFIHIVRDGRDCTVSAWYHNLRINAAALTRRYPTFGDFAGYFAQVWVDNVSQGAKFAAAQPERCMAVRYEDLAHQPLRLLDRLCDFLGASRDPAVLRDCCAAADFNRLSGGRPRGQEDRESFFRHGVAGDWRSHFDTHTDVAFRAKVEPWMSGFRYL
jgi:Sulfotransferase family